MSAPVTVVTADDNNSYALGQVRVWVMPATPADPTLGRISGYTFPWAWSSWAECKRLIPISATRSTGSMGTAAFRMLRYTRTDPRRNWPVAESDEVIEGSYVCITIGTATAADPSDTSAHPRQILSASAIQWFGYITQIEGEVLKGTTEMLGKVTAREVGGLLDAQQIYGWGRYPTSGGYPEVMTNPPTANLATPTGTVIGNAKFTNAFDPNGVFSSGYVFARAPSDCGTSSSQLWTRDRLLNHLLALCRPASLPGISLAYDQATIQGYLDDYTTPPEVFELRNLTYKGAFDMIAPAVRCLGWYITVAASGWTLHLFSYADTTAYGVPQNIPVDVTLSTSNVAGTNQPVDSVSFTYSYDMPDEVVIEGNPLVFTGTVSYKDGNLASGWTAAQEISYRAGASLNLDGSTNSGYPGDAPNQKILNAAIRESSSLRDVFTRFLLNPTTRPTVGDLVVNANAGLNTGATRPMCPQVTWSGTTLSATTSASSTPYLPSARLLRTLSWPEGIRSDCTDTRDATGKAIPQFLPIRVFRYDTNLGTYSWRDQNAQNGRPALPSMSVEPDDHGPGVRIRFTPAEILAKTHWSGAKLADIDPDALDAAFDWQQLVVTVAIESDQRVRVTKRRQTTTGSGGAHDISGSDVRVRLVIPAPDLHCWCTHVGTVLGLLATGQPDRVNLSHADPTAILLDSSTSSGLAYMTRNDFAVAEKRAKQAAAFAFRKRSACAITRARFDALPQWAALGYMIGSVKDTLADGTTSGSTTLANTVVTSLQFSFGESPRVTVSTDLPTMPAFPSIPGGGSPTGGGAVSASLSGTTAQAISRVAGQVGTSVNRDAQRIPVVHNRTPLQQPLVLLQIIDGQTVYNSGGVLYYGISKSFATYTSVGTQYDPNVDTTPGTFTAADAGIGRAYIYLDGVQQATPVLVLIDSRSPVPVDLVSGDYILADTQVSIDGPTDKLTLWIAKML